MWRSWRRDVLVLLGYLAVSCAYFGWQLLPHPGSTLLGAGSDPGIFVWSFGWWPHALLTASNPFVTHDLYAPAGANLAWVTSVPGLAVAFAPLTLLFGPVISFNIAGLVLPALAAWTAYRLCLALTTSFWASLTGGYLFGFSSFVIAQQLQGHLNLSGCFALPLVALCFVRWLEGHWTRRRFTVSVGVLIALQLSISTEVTLTLTLALVLCLGLAVALAPSSRRRLRALAGPLVGAYLIAMLLTAPLLVYAGLANQPQAFNGGSETTDLANLLVPTSVNGVAGGRFPSIQAYFNPHESALYLGPPTLLIIALFAWRRWRDELGRVLLAAFLVAVVLALGSSLVVDGHVLIALPWAIADHVPDLDDAVAPRFAEYAVLAAAVIVALWVARSKRWVFALPLLSVAALIPVAWHPLGTSTVGEQRFFSASLYRSCFPRGETLAVFPFGGDDAQVLQAESGFYFRLAGGYLTPVVFGVRSVVSFNSDPTVGELDLFGDRGLPSTDALLAFAVRQRIDRFVVIGNSNYPSRAAMAAIGPVEQIGGILIAPACGSPSLERHKPSASVERLNQEQLDGVSIQYCRGGYSYDLPAGLNPGGILAGATHAAFVAGQGLTCSVPAGYHQNGFAGPSLGVPGGTYRYYVGG